MTESEWEYDDDDAELHPPSLDSTIRIGVPTTVLSSLSSQLNILRFVKVVVHDIMNMIFTFQHAHFDTSSISCK